MARCPAAKSLPPPSTPRCTCGAPIFGESETAMRLMSFCAAVPLVGVTAWLSAMLGRSQLAGALGGLAAAVSPLVLEYGTQVRAYIFCMLAVTLAGAAAVRYMTEVVKHREWLILSGAAGVGALWLHYTAIPVIAALAFWLLLDRRVPKHLSVSYAVALAAAQLAVTPLMLDQTQNAGATAFGKLTVENIIRTFGAPLDGRCRLSVLLPLAALVIFAAATTWALRQKNVEVRAVAAIALASPTGLLVLTLGSDDALLSRYSAVTAPLMIAVIVAAAAQARWLRPAVGLLLILAVGASIASHSDKGQFPDLGGAYEVIGASDAKTAPIVIAPERLGELASLPLVNYYRRDLPSTATLALPDPRATAALTKAPQAWIIRDGMAPNAQAEEFLLRAFRAKLVRSTSLPGRDRLQVMLIER